MSRTILVVGSTGLVGKCITEGLLADGDFVIGISKSNITDAKRYFGSESYLHISLDLLMDFDLTAIKMKLTQIKKQIDGLVYASRDRKFLRGLESTSDDWINEFKLAVLVPYKLISELVLCHPLTSIVMINSIYGLVAQKPDLYKDPLLSLNPHYGCSKAAALQLARDLSVKLAPACKINSLVLGGLDHNVDPITKSNYVQQTPDRKMIDPRFVYGPVKFLLGTDSSGLTGSVVLQDGGWTAW
jgi:NAD(P)-dependent dehydrogenase (short-subunit alcohol dehydrogenase family)